MRSRQAMKQIVLMVVILTICNISRAAEVMVAGGATGVGDGGHGVVCTSPSGSRTFELLDLVEGLQARGERFDFMSFETSYTDEIHALQSAFEATTGVTAFRENFASATNLRPVLRDGLAPSFDFLPLALELKPGCELRQIGFRYFAFSRALVEVDLEAWQAFDARRQALLMIHEALHDRFPSGLEGATALREVVAFIASPVDVQIKNAAHIRRVIEEQMRLAFLQSN